MEAYLKNEYIRGRLACEAEDRVLHGIPGSPFAWAKESGLVGFCFCADEIDSSVCKAKLVFLKPFSEDRCIGECNTAYIIVTAGSCVFGFCDEFSTKAFGEVVERVNSAGTKSLVAFVGKLLVEIAKGDQRALFVGDDRLGTLNNVKGRLVELLSDDHTRLGIDFMLCLLHMSLTNGKRHLLCNPYPEHMFGKDEIGLDSVKKALDKLPALIKIVQSKGQILAPEMTDSVALLQWVAVLPHTLRPTNVEGTKLDCIRSISLEIQGTHLPSEDSQPVEVLVGYHGTAGENVHSILQNGLRTMSGTRLMKHGKAFGDGVYLSTDRGVAEMFASQFPPRSFWLNSVFKSPSVTKVSCAFTFEAQVKLGDTVTKVGGDDAKESYLVVEEPMAISISKLHVQFTPAKKSRERGRLRPYSFVGALVITLVLWFFFYWVQYYHH
mmetsp:Transcript_39650/g.64307  ORF Transcript_39650/g.64307 Transcript_39650/m.64307 type:complete len:437 (+) Transcript_39650:57-1367(+)